ncbi:integral membrane protein [Bordetella ansorpii]|uniref:Integral membrane protein n=2 Tax=Bordetella ansorpii TaxID=288768 RepID=A0A157QC52_9BORD|nr:integral membrane protein [Bordetella ansorpii]
MLLASAMFAVMGSFVKLGVDHGATLPQVILFRGLPSVVLLLLWARAARQSIIPTSWRLHLWRNLAGVTSMWMGFYAVSHLPLATATSLNYTAPLFIACYMLGWGGAQRDPVRIMAVAIGFFGVIAVLRPSIGEDQWMAAAAGLVAGAMSAVAMMQIRQLGRIGEPEWRTVLFFSVGVCVSSMVGLFIGGWGDADWRGYLSLVGVGTAGMFGQLALTRAFGHGSALLTAALQYTTIIFAALIGMGFWGDTLDEFAWAGMGMIICAGLLSVWRTMREPVAAPARTKSK